MALPKIGQTISADEFNRLPNIGETITEEQFNALPDSGLQEQPKRLFSGIRQDISKRAEQFAGGLEAQKRGEQTGLETGLQFGGAVAGLGTDIALRGLQTITPKPIEKGIGRLFSETGRLIGKIPGMGKVIQEIQERPRLARNLEAGVDIASILPVGKGVQIAGRAGLKTITKTGERLAFRAEQKGLQEAVELTKPVLSKQETITVFEKAGKPGGITQKSKFGKITKQPTLEEVNIAQTAQPFISRKKGISRNLYNLNQEIERFSTSEVRPFLQQNPRIFNIKTLESNLKKVEPPDWIKTDKVGESTYNFIKQRMIDAAKKNPKNMEGLWDSRIDFDNIIERQFGGAIFDPNKRAFVNQAVRDVRRATNEFIGNSIGDNRFTESMKRLNRFYEARGNIAEQKYKLLDKNFLQRYYKEHPGASKLITRIGLGTGGLYGYFQLRDFLGD